VERNNVVGWIRFILKEKLEGVKKRLRLWSIEGYGSGE